MNEIIKIQIGYLDVSMERMKTIYNLYAKTY